MKIIKDSLSKLIYSEKQKYYIEKPAMATRQCSMKVIEALNNIMPNLVGGSADLSGSNNTKTSNSIVLNSKTTVEIIYILELENMVWLLL